MRETRSTLIFCLPAEGACGTPAWRPMADIFRTRDGWVIKLDLAGVCPEDVTVIARGSQLLISGTRRDRIVEEGWNHYAMEIIYDRFERTFELPCELERADFRMECREGMLLVRVAMNEETNDE
ncbi:MAG TPA: Hsp20/alpha crystallin family protein [Blastocatellia bacterium]|nr:Hsp20/alpha crystallin family protein [Blastocatellia bacterium]